MTRRPRALATVCSPKRCAAALVVCAVNALAVSGFAAVGLYSRHYPSRQALAPFIQGGLEFVVRADTEKLEAIRFDPPADDQTAFDLWNNGVPHAFKAVHNAAGVTGIAVDDRDATVSPVTIDPATNALLISTVAAGDGRSVQLANLKLTLPGFEILNVGDMALAPPSDFLVIRTSRRLASGFILSGTATLTWTGALPPPSDEWFEITPFIFSDPCDTNCDGSVNDNDVPGLVAGILYKTQCSPRACDCNGDGTVNMFDIQPFVECVWGN